jgi:hypothetical protein
VPTTIVAPFGPWEPAHPPEAAALFAAMPCPWWIAGGFAIELAIGRRGPVLRRADPQRSLDLTVWASRRWRGDVSNMQPHEHDAIGWFTAAQVQELKLADPSYLTVLRRLLRGEPLGASSSPKSTRGSTLAPSRVNTHSGA